MKIYGVYIEEIISEEYYCPHLFGKKKVEVKMKVNCGGTIMEVTRILPIREWKKAKRCGFIDL